MSKVTIELNSEGVKELLKSPEMLDICVEQAEAIKDRYGEEATVSGYVGRNRVNASVSAPYDEALLNNDLLKAVREE